MKTFNIHITCYEDNIEKVNSIIEKIEDANFGAEINVNITAIGDIAQ